MRPVAVTRSAVMTGSSTTVPAGPRAVHTWCRPGTTCLAAVGRRRWNGTLGDVAVYTQWSGDSVICRGGTD